MLNIAIVPGDGIGPEITAATLHALEALDRRFGLGLSTQRLASGLEGWKLHGVTVRDEDLATARDADGVILGPMSVNTYPPAAQGGLHVPAIYRSALDLYANIRPSRTRKGVPAVIRQMDLVMVRENLEDFYVDRNMHQGIGEFMPTPDTVIAMGKITANGSRRIARAAFEIARRRPRRHLTIVHKLSVYKLYHGLFVSCAREIAKEYPDVTVEEFIVDAMAALLVRKPEYFDVILTTNTVGDILSDEASELAGSLGLAASLNHGDRCAVAQAGHGSAPDIAGKDLANPTSLMLSAGMMLEHIGIKRGIDACVAAAHCLDEIVDAMLETGATRTPDLGGVLGTRAFGEGVAERIARGDL